MNPLKKILADRDLVAHANATDLDLLNQVMTIRAFQEEEWPIIRKALRDELLVSALIDEHGSEFTATFSGSGDSGNYDGLTDHWDHPLKDQINWFFERMVDLHVNFDWYNNDGGGGELTWNVMTDVLTISGYVNITTTESVMEGEY